MVILLRFVKIAFSILAAGGGSEICMCACAKYVLCA